MTPLLSEFVDPNTGEMDANLQQAILNYDPSVNYFSFDWNRQFTSVQEAREIQQGMAQGKSGTKRSPCARQSRHPQQSLLAHSVPLLPSIAFRCAVFARCRAGSHVSGDPTRFVDRCVAVLSYFAQKQGRLTFTQPRRIFSFFF